MRSNDHLSAAYVFLPSYTRRRRIIEETISVTPYSINFQRERLCWQLSVYKIAQSAKTLSDILSSNIVYEGQQYVFKLNRSQTYIFNMWNALEIHDRSNNAVRHAHAVQSTETLSESDSECAMFGKNSVLA